MSEGRIFVAEYQGYYLLKFVGDIRLTLSVALEDCIHKMLADPNFKSISVDLNEAKGLDSTSLGVLAKLAIQMNAQHQMQPLLFSMNPDVTIILLRMGLDELFQIKQQPSTRAACNAMLRELEAVGCENEDGMRCRVLEAHKVLMSLNERNHLAFAELVQALE